MFSDRFWTYNWNATLCCHQLPLPLCYSCNRKCLQHWYDYNFIQRQVTQSACTISNQIALCLNFLFCSISRIWNSLCCVAVTVFPCFSFFTSWWESLGRLISRDNPLHFWIRPETSPYELSFVNIGVNNTLGDSLLYPIISVLESKNRNFKSF